MWYWKGFKSLAAAKAYAREKGGIVFYDRRTPVRQLMTDTAKEFYYVCEAAGINPAEWPYVVTLPAGTRRKH